MRRLHNYYLPMWLHRVCNGVFGTVASVGIAAVGLTSLPPGHFLHQLSLVLFFLSAPIGLLLAALAPRLSIVEGLAGDAGYDDLVEHHDNDGT